MNNEQPRKLFRILSIDGGGIRGAASAAFLAKLEGDLGAPLHQHFDYFAGTSAGGLLALFLGAKGGAAVAATAMFAPESAARLMDKSLFDRIVPTALQPGPKYDGKGKAAVLAQVFGDARIQSAIKPTLVTAYDPAIKRFVVFKSHGGLYTRDNPLMWEVADATSAAPMYFPPAWVHGDEDHYLVDGGLGANNPAMAAVAEAIKVGVRPGDIVVVSVGTGHAPIKRSFAREFREEGKTWGGVDWLRQGIVDHLIEASSSATDYWCQQVLGSRYVRVQGVLGPGASDELDNVSASNIEALRATGEGWYERDRDIVRWAVDRPGISLGAIPRLPAVCLPPEDDQDGRVVA